MSDHLPSLAQRGFARPSIVQTPVGAGGVGHFRPSNYAALMEGSPLLASPLPLPASPVAPTGSGQKAGHRAGAPCKLATPARHPPTLPCAAGVATRHQRPFKCVAHFAGIDDCGCGAGGARAGRTWRWERMKHEKVWKFRIRIHS